MMNITPFSTFNTNFQKPFDHRYRTPVYDPTDLIGDFDDDGNPIGMEHLTIPEIFFIGKKIIQELTKILILLEQESP